MSALAPFAALPAEARARMLALGPVWHRDIRAHSDQVKSIYAPLLAAAPRGGVTVDRDVAYGTHARQVLDIFRPVAPRPDGAVVVFVHGGAFVRGNKRTTTDIYDNVLYWFARHGFVGINVEYRLAPEAAYPGGADDVALAMAWIARNAERHGGHPTRLHLVGHSAGGTHVASFVYDPALPYRGRHTRAIVLISARLRADRSPANPNASGVGAYFGDDTARYDGMSPVTHAACSALPVMIVTAEYENPLLDVYGLEMAHAVAAARGRAPRFLCMPHHNHMSIVAHFNTAEDLLGREILAFFDSLP